MPGWPRSISSLYIAMINAVFSCVDTVAHFPHFRRFIVLVPAAADRTRPRYAIDLSHRVASHAFATAGRVVRPVCRTRTFSVQCHDVVDDADAARVDVGPVLLRRSAATPVAAVWNELPVVDGRLVRRRRRRRKGSGCLQLRARDDASGRADDAAAWSYRRLRVNGCRQQQYVRIIIKIIKVIIASMRECGVE